MASPWKEVLALCDTVDALLKDAYPADDAGRRNQVQSACIRMTGRDGYITNKANNLASRAGIYFSARRHESHPGGAGALMQEMRYSLLSGIRQQAQMLEERAASRDHAGD